jgi:hypothetical protein
MINRDRERKEEEIKSKKMRKERGEGRRRG